MAPATSFLKNVHRYHIRSRPVAHCHSAVDSLRSRCHREELPTQHGMPALWAQKAYLDKPQDEQGLIAEQKRIGAATNFGLLFFGEDVQLKPRLQLTTGS